MADDIVGSFNNLPIETLISAPLNAAAASNIELAQATYDFISNVWLDPKNKQPRMLEFPLERPVDAGGTEKITVTAPFAALAQLPNLMVQSVDVNFSMEVKNTSKSTQSQTAEAKLDVSARFGFISAKLTGSLSTKSENTRSTDQSAKYDIKVHANQANPTEGMNKLAQVFASCIEPRVTK